MLIKLNAQRLGKLVFRNKAYGDDKRIALDPFGALRDRLIVFVNGADLDSFESVLSEHARYSVAQVQGYIIIGKALIDISRKSRGRGVDFINAEDLRSLKSKSARHDKADIARTEDNTFFRRHDTETVCEMLRCAGSEHSCRARSVDKNLLCASLAAAGRKDKALGRDCAQPLTRHEGDGKAALGFFRARNEGIAGRFDIRLRYLIHKALDILGACKALAEAAQAEAVVYALLEHSAKALLALNDEHSRAVFVCRKCGRKAGRAAAYHDDIVIMHCRCLPFCFRKLSATDRSFSLPP